MSAFPRLVSSSRSSCRVLFRSSPSIPRTSSSSSSSPLPPPSTTLQRRHLHSPLQQLTSHSPPAWSKPIDAYLAEHLPPHPTITPSSPSTSPSAPSASSPSSSYSPSASHPYFLPHSSTNTSLFYTARITAAPHRYWDIDSCLAVLEHEPHLVSSSALFWPWLFPTMEKASANPGAHPLHVVDVDLIHRYPEVLERYERAHKLALRCHGIHLNDRITGLLTKGENWSEGMTQLFSHPSRLALITRLLKSFNDMSTPCFPQTLEALQHSHNPSFSRSSPSSSETSSPLTPLAYPSHTHHASSLVLFLLAQHNDGHLNLSPGTLGGHLLETRWAPLVHPEVQEEVELVISRRRGTGGEGNGGFGVEEYERYILTHNAPNHTLAQIRSVGSTLSKLDANFHHRDRFNWLPDFRPSSPSARVKHYRILHEEPGHSRAEAKRLGFQDPRFYYWSLPGGVKRLVMPRALADDEHLREGVGRFLDWAEPARAYGLWEERDRLKRTRDEAAHWIATGRNLPKEKDVLAAQEGMQGMKSQGVRTAKEELVEAPKGVLRATEMVEEVVKVEMRREGERPWLALLEEGPEGKTSTPLASLGKGAGREPIAKAGRGSPRREFGL